VTRFTPLWLQSGSYAASVDRRLLSALWPGARSTGAAVTVATGMQLSAAAGQITVPAANGTGTVLCAWDAPETVTLDPSPAAGTNRIDTIICQARGNDLDGGVNNDFVITFAKGTEAASPVAPALPANSSALADIYVGGGVAAIVAGNITDRRPGNLAVPVLGAAVKRYPLRAVRNAAFTSPATPNTLTEPFPWDSVTWDTDGVWQPSPAFAYRCPVAGWYEVIAQLSFNLSANTNLSSRIFQNHTVQALSPSTNNTTGGASAWTANANCILSCNVGDLITTGMASNMASSAARAPAPSEAYLNIVFLGPP